MVSTCVLLYRSAAVQYDDSFLMLGLNIHKLSACRAHGPKSRGLAVANQKAPQGTEGTDSRIGKVPNTECGEVFRWCVLSFSRVFGWVREEKSLPIPSSVYMLLVLAFGARVG